MIRTFTLSNVSKQTLHFIIKQMLVVDKCINLKIDEHSVSSSSAFAARDVVKHLSIKNENLFENEFSCDKPLKISFVNCTKLLLLLSNFKENKLDMDIFYDDLEEGDEYYATKVTLKTKSLSITEMCVDRNYTTLTSINIPDSLISSLISTTDSTVHFNIESKDIKNIKSLFLIEKSVQYFKYITRSNEVSIQELSDLEDETSVIYNKWLADIDKTEDGEYLCNKNVFSVIGDAFSYDVDICINDELHKVVYSYEDEGVKIVIVAAI